MLRIDKVPYEDVHPDLRPTIKLSDEALGGSEWIQVFAQTPLLYRDFVKFYYEHIVAEEHGITVKLTELIRHKVAQVNQCPL